VFISADEHASVPASSAAVPRSAPQPVTRTAYTPAPAAGPAAAPAEVIPDGEAIRSPSPGIFWRSPAPGAPPFIEVGQRIEAGNAVCIVEVMKLMNRIIAGRSGRVVAILVENSAKVERGQPLVIIDPDPGA